MGSKPQDPHDFIPGRVVRRALINQTTQVVHRQVVLGDAAREPHKLAVCERHAVRKLARYRNDVERRWADHGATRGARAVLTVAVELRLPARPAVAAHDVLARKHRPLIGHVDAHAARLLLPERRRCALLLERMAGALGAHLDAIGPARPSTHVGRLSCRKKMHSIVSGSDRSLYSQPVTPVTMLLPVAFIESLVPFNVSLAADDVPTNDDTTIPLRLISVNVTPFAFTP